MQSVTKLQIQIHRIQVIFQFFYCFNKSAFLSLNFDKLCLGVLLIAFSGILIEGL